MKTAREMLQQNHIRKKLQYEIERLEDRKKYVLSKSEVERSFDEQKFIEGVDETIQRYIRELQEL